MGFDFSLVDVFSDRPFGGNQLAVFPDATGIADATMQQLAREFNFSETTFVLPPRDPSSTCQVRIFTPRQELPFAGHPTVGTAAVLAGQADNHELARAREVVSEPPLALIRLQWWREVVEGAYRRHQVAEPLAAAIEAGALDREPLLAMIDAREVEVEPAI